MEYKHKGKVYSIKYEIDDMYEHMYNIFLVHNSIEYTMDELGILEREQALIERRVDEDAFSSAIDNAEYQYSER